MSTLLFSNSRWKAGSRFCRKVKVLLMNYSCPNETQCYRDLYGLEVPIRETVEGNSSTPL